MNHEAENETIARYESLRRLHDALKRVLSELESELVDVEMRLPEGYQTGDEDFRDDI